MGVLGIKKLCADGCLLFRRFQNGDWPRLIDVRRRVSGLGVESSNLSAPTNKRPKPFWVEYMQQPNPNSPWPASEPAIQRRCVCTATDFAEKSFSRRADGRV